jgi:hypothetical protein
VIHIKNIFKWAAAVSPQLNNLLPIQQEKIKQINKTVRWNYKTTLSLSKQGLLQDVGSQG